MSGNFWQRRFHSDPKVVGSVLHLNGAAFTVVGVTPLNYLAGLPAVPDLWAPVAAKMSLGFSAKDLANRLVSAGFADGRLRPGVHLSDAQAELNVLAEQLQAAYPEAERNKGVKVLSASNFLAAIEPEMWGVVAAAMSAVALLLLIACANVASLLLGRAVARRKEIAVRLALGAGRWRLLRQLLTESMLLALLAGAIGLPLGGWILHLLILQIASALPSFWGTIALELTPDFRIFAYTVLVSCGAGIAFGLSPALQASKADVNSALKEEGSTFGRRISSSRLRGLLIAGQMAACLLLLITSALLLRGSQRALKIEPGYEARHVVSLERYDPANLHYSQARLLQLNRDIIQGIATLPGVQSVTQASRSPVGGIRWVPVAPAGTALSGPDTSGSEPPAAGYSYVTPNYFETLGIAILRGRNFTSREAEGQSPVVIISEATAGRFWPSGDAIGKRIRIGSDKGTMSFPGEKDPFIASSEVIGIARDVRSLDLRKIDESYLYLPLSQSKQWTSILLVRTAGDLKSLLPAIGHEVRRLDANLPVIAAPLNTMISMDPYFVISRIGGILAGILVGIAGSAIVSRLLAATLFGLSSMDAVSFAGVSLLLGFVALLATWLPARRATCVDPMVALRYE